MKTRAENLEEKAGRAPEREPVPIVVTVFHREEDTRKMFEQLARVTSNYLLIIVNNGFDDPDYIKGLGPLHYIENEENTGAIRPINQGLEVAEGEYIAVLHSDLLIYDEGWLDHIVDFLDRRPDVGLVGLAGRHVIKQNGGVDLDTTLFNMDEYHDSIKPTWRFTEVATIDGIGWVMRNMGLRLDEGLGLMHYYDLDLSLQYIEGGYKVYVTGVRVFHSGLYRSSRYTDKYLEKIGGDDELYYEQVREKFRKKWSHMLPITRGFMDEFYDLDRINHLENVVRALESAGGEASRHIEKLEEEISARSMELEKVARHIAQVEEDNRAKAAELEKVGKDIKELEGPIRALNPDNKLVKP